MMTRVRTLPLIALVASMMLASLASAAQPITTDSRIKTLVFNPNEVFTITTHYGYQSNIEFGPKEVIDTISVGDRIGWQITPAGRRLFIRAQEENAHTNMTVITNLRAYQFDLRSSAADAVFGSEELTCSRRPDTACAARASRCRAAAYANRQHRKQCVVIVAKGTDVVALAQTKIRADEITIHCLVRCIVGTRKGDDALGNAGFFIDLNQIRLHRFEWGQPEHSEGCNGSRKQRDHSNQGQHVALGQHVLVFILIPVLRTIRNILLVALKHSDTPVN
jgi:hypothetical protein